MEDIIRKAIEELMESKDREVRFDINKDTIDLKVDKVLEIVNDKEVNTCYKVTMWIGGVEYIIECSLEEYNVDYISKTVIYVINRSIHTREELEKMTWANAKLNIFCDENEDKE